MMPSRYCCRGKSGNTYTPPIGINIKVGRSLACDFTLNTPVTVYLIQKRAKPTGILHGTVVFNDD